MLKFKLFWENFAPNKILYIICIILYAILPLGSILQADVVKRILDDAIGKNMTDILMGLLIQLMIIQLIRSVLHYTFRNVFHHSSQNLLFNLRKNLYHNIQTQDMTFFREYSTGDLMSRLSGDLDMVRFFISYFIPSSVDSLVLFFSTLIYLFFINTTLTLFLMVCAPFVFFFTSLMRKSVRPYYRKMREKLADLNKVTQENIAGNRVVKAYAKEDFEIEKFDIENNNLRELQILANKKYIKFNTPIDIIATLMAAIALVGGGILAINGKLSIGELSIFTSLSWSLAFPLRTLGTLINDKERVFTAIDRVVPIYYAKTKIFNTENPIKPEKINGDISFKNVSLKLENNLILENVSFEIKKGETLAIMGPTGSGKTFITNLILRLYDVTEGQVLIDNIDVREYDLKTLRSLTAVSTQDVFLFSETIEGNICYGVPEIPMEEVEFAARNAQAFDFIKETSDGFETIIGERGVGLSGGQKQRLALARAFAVNSPVLILDDTTSALDMETESQIQKSLRDNYKDTTQIIIAQRISSVKHADKIIILENGRITQQGTHEELIKSHGYYRDIYDLQSGNNNDIGVNRKSGVLNIPQ